MRLTQAEFDYAFSILSAIHNPEYQRGFAVVLLSRVNERIKKESGYPYVSVLLTDRKIEEFKELAKEEVDNYIKESEYKNNISNSIYLSKIGIKIVLVDKDTIKIHGNPYIQELLDGVAPVQFFNHSREVIENMWKEYKENNNV